MIDYPCFVIAGGKSSRMKSNKMLLDFGEVSLINFIYDNLVRQFKITNFICNNPELLDKNWKYYKDVISSVGPISGIHSALLHSNDSYVFIIGGDMPFIKTEAIYYLANKLNGQDILIFSENSKRQFLFGFYNKSLIPIIESKISSVNVLENQKISFSLRELFEITNSEAIEITEQDFYNKNMFFNINTIEDYQTALIIKDKYIFT